MNFFHGDARLHTPACTQALLDHFNWKLFDHPPYSPDLTPSMWLGMIQPVHKGLKRKLLGRPWASGGDVEHTWVSCIQSQNKFIAGFSLQLGLPKTMIQNLLHKWLRLHAYKIQLRHGFSSTGFHKLAYP
jgi:hypothetical protein